MWAGIRRELCYLLREKWDLALVVLAPACILILLGSMFAQGKPDHLAIAIIDQDQSRLSTQIYDHLSLNHTLQIYIISDQTIEVEKLLNQNKIWGYIHIPAGAEQRLVTAQDAEISIAFNQSYFSIGNTISSAMLLSTLQAMAEFTGRQYLGNTLPYLEVPTPNIKISPLYNPQLNYEFYLEPYMVPAILHLLLCCCVAFAVGQEIKRHTFNHWINGQNLWSALLSKNLVYVAIFCFWTWVWMLWMVEFRGWFIAGSLWLILLAQVLFYSAYAFISSAVVLATQDLSKSFGLLAVYGGSSLSFAGVTLPLNNAPLFTQLWANIIPYTPYAKLQTEQWVIGSPLYLSAQPIFILTTYVVLYAVLAYVFLKKIVKGVST
ncbi:multidrug ABC transporter permease [Acinetobacter sp. ACNIH3]|uniref:ABC transporter permease n=1 Tax=unclassified Acinetobacter TaxID=196816 RepID=UPI000CDCEB9D|nr:MULTISPECIES: ABC transporter permease [unclassified Acinetobacter]POU25465.1 multidrug ABC transporter permease [Acinetobacter sp. ACNIH3]POV79435.1 multidrug ABC transporter permease [Acinetobacter sp. ACNIH4]